jgi:uncharacterized membrane protein YeiH
MAVRLRQTLVTAGFFALVTGVGGGSVRDLLIGAPVFWVHDGAIAAMCIAIALVVWVTPERWWRGQLLEWADAVGLAGYAVFGTAKAIAWGVPPAPALLMGVITGCVGGTIRDVLAGVPSIIVRPEIYVTAAALASGLYLALLWAGAGTAVAAVAGATAGFLLRGAAIRWSLALPSYGAKDEKAG